MKKNLTIFILGIILGGIIGYFIGYSPVESSIKTETITCIVHDTIAVESPKIVQIRVVDTMLVEVTDTLRVRDTLYLPLERTQVVAQDSNYRVVASGFRPSIDSVCIYNSTIYQTQIVEKTIAKKTKHWGIGVSAGYGFALQKEAVVAAPTISVGFGYYIPLF